jgi:hypothetical protein
MQLSTMLLIYEGILTPTLVMPVFILRCTQTPTAHGRKQCRLGLACRFGGLVEGEHRHGRWVVEYPVLVIDDGVVVYH